MKTILLVLANPVSPDQERAFNVWYNQVHIPELTALPGVRGASRFMLTDPQPDGAALGHKYLALYEIDGDNVEGVVEVLRDARPMLTGTQTLDVATFTSMIFRQIDH